MRERDISRSVELSRGRRKCRHNVTYVTMDVDSGSDIGER